MTSITWTAIICCICPQSVGHISGEPEGKTLALSVINTFNLRSKDSDIFRIIAKFAPKISIVYQVTDESGIHPIIKSAVDSASVQDPS
jgi:hypothetical protein